MRLAASANTRDDDPDSDSDDLAEIQKIQVAARS